MVDYLAPGTDDVKFANDTPITSLTKAKALASRQSKAVDTGAYVVAFAAVDGGKSFVAVGHIAFYDGKQSATDGQVV
jgi:hypothetical protein